MQIPSSDPCHLSTHLVPTLLLIPSLPGSTPYILPYPAYSHPRAWALGSLDLGYSSSDICKSQQKCHCLGEAFADHSGPPRHWPSHYAVVVSYGAYNNLKSLISLLTIGLSYQHDILVKDISYMSAEAWSTLFICHILSACPTVCSL